MLDEDLKIRAKGSVIESPRSWGFVGFYDILIQLIPSFLIKTVSKSLSMFINQEGSLLLFSNGVGWEAKSLLKIFAFSRIFLLVLPDKRIAGTERILMLFRKFFKTFQ